MTLQSKGKPKGFCEYCLTKETQHEVMTTEGDLLFCCMECERDFPNDEE